MLTWPDYITILMLALWLSVHGPLSAGRDGEIH
jgi:hypothetical protein